VSARTYFLANRLWWAGALLVAPVIGAFAHDAAAGIVAAGVLVMPTLIVFDTDRRWWSDEVKQLPHRDAGSRTETWSLTIWAAGGLAAGLLIAFLGPW
jgi:hypothetical protein